MIDAEYLADVLAMNRIEQEHGQWGFRDLSFEFYYDDEGARLHTMYYNYYLETIKIYENGRL